MIQKGFRKVSNFRVSRVARSDSSSCCSPKSKLQGTKSVLCLPFRKVLSKFEAYDLKWMCIANLCVSNCIRAKSIDKGVLFFKKFLKLSRTSWLCTKESVSSPTNHPRFFRSKSVLGCLKFDLSFSKRKQRKALVQKRFRPHPSSINRRELC